jgi:hypothetical protein
MAFAIFRVETFEKSNLIIRELYEILLPILFEPQKTLVLGQEIMASPYSTNTFRVDDEASEHEVLGNTNRTMGWLFETVIEDCFIKFI